MSRLKQALLAAAAAVTIALGFGVAAATPTVTAGAAGPAVQQTWSGLKTCTTNSAGYCTIPHTAGVVPDSVTVTPTTPAITSVDQLTAVTFRVRFARAISATGTVTPLTGTRSLYVHIDWTPGVPPSPTPSASPSPSDSPTPGPEPSPSASSSPSESPSSSPTPSPTPTTGDWPGPDNTGVPAVVTLTPYTGPCTITAPNTVIEAKDITCDLNIHATGVLITDSRIHGQIDTDEGTSAGFWLQDSEVINGKRDSCLCIGSDHFTLLRVEVTGGYRGVYCRLDCTVQDSWIHGTDLLFGQHASAVRVEQHATLTHNTLQCDWTAITDPEIGCSADMTGYPDFAPIHHNTIDGNLFKANPGGLGFCAYGGGTAGKPFSGDPSNATFVVFRDNVFERGSNRLCGQWGPITDFIPGRTGNVWDNNRWTDGALVGPA